MSNINSKLMNYVPYLKNFISQKQEEIKLKKKPLQKNFKSVPIEIEDALESSSPTTSSPSSPQLPSWASIQKVYL